MNYCCAFTIAVGINARIDFVGSYGYIFQREKVYAYRKGVILSKSDMQPSVKPARTP